MLIRFNGAAIRGRRRAHGNPPGLHQARVASMGPPSEDGGESSARMPTSPPRWSFNGAAIRGRRRDAEGQSG